MKVLIAIVIIVGAIILLSCAIALILGQFFRWRNARRTRYTELPVNAAY